MIIATPVEGKSLGFTDSKQPNNLKEACNNILCGKKTLALNLTGNHFFCISALQGKVFPVHAMKVHGEEYRHTSTHSLNRLKIEMPGRFTPGPEGYAK
jgi:hypothetical protein